MTVLLKVFQVIARKFKTRRIKKKLSIYQKMKPKQYIYKKYGTISILFLSQKLRSYFLWMKRMDKLAMRTRLHLEAATKICFWYIFSKCTNGDMFKNMVQESNLKASDKLVSHFKECKKQSYVINRHWQR